MMAEDANMNQMMDSMTLFGRVCNNRWLAGTPIVLFLNKTDLFRKKILHSPLTSCFPEYNGNGSYEDASSCIQTKFADLSKGERSKNVFTHFSCALHTEDIEPVFADIAAMFETPIQRQIIATNIKGCEIC